MEVVHEDYLERSINVSETKKDFKKGYFVFRRNNAGSEMLEYYKDSNWKKQEPRGIFNLINGYSIEPLIETKKKFGMLLKTVDKTVELFSSTEESRKKWLNVLKEGLKGYYNASLLDSPSGAHSLVRNLKQIELHITDSSLVMSSNRVPIITWRFSTIRKYKAMNGAFVLEVGRKAPTGEGIFRFHVSDPCQLFDELDKALKERIKVKRTKESETTRLPSADNSDLRLSFVESSTLKRSSFSYRSPSIEERTFDSPVEYSSLDNVPVKTIPVTPEVNGYDRLFADAFSLSNINDNQHSVISLSDSTTPIKPISLGKNSEGGENYIDMSGLKEEIVRECRNSLYDKKEVKNRPIPTPRSKPFINSAGDNKPPSVDVDLIDFNTYDCPSATVQQPDVSSGYHLLNKLTPTKNSCTISGYDHLRGNLMLGNGSANAKGDINKNDVQYQKQFEIYDSPKSYAYSGQNSESNDKKPPPKPVRPPPPLRRQREDNDSIGCCQTSPKSAQMMQNRLEIHPSTTHASIRESIYDSPRAAINVNAFLGSSQNLDDIYQVPRSDP